MIAVTRLSLSKDHLQPVYALASSPGGYFSAGADRLVLYHPDHTAEVKRVAAIPHTIYSLLYLPDSGLLLAGQATGGIHIIDLAAGQELRYLLRHTGGVFSLVHDVAGRRVFATSADGSVSVWKQDSWELVGWLPLSAEKIRSLAIAPDQSCIAVACSDAHIRILDYNDLGIRHTFRAHGWAANAVCWHPQQPWLISGSRDAHLRVWDATANYTLLHDIPAHNYAIYAIVSSPDGSLLATASRDKTVKIWDAATMDFRLRINRENFQGHSHSVNTLLWNEHSGILYSGSDDHTILGWQVEPA